MKRKVRYWHGKPWAPEGKTHPLVEKVEANCIEQDGEWWWIGSLDEFAEIFGKFLLMGDFIAVTQHSNFGTR